MSKKRKYGLRVIRTVVKNVKVKSNGRKVVIGIKAIPGSKTPSVTAVARKEPTSASMECWSSNNAEYRVDNGAFGPKEISFLKEDIEGQIPWGEEVFVYMTLDGPEEFQRAGTGFVTDGGAQVANGFIPNITWNEIGQPDPASGNCIVKFCLIPSARSPRSVGIRGIYTEGTPYKKPNSKVIVSSKSVPHTVGLRRIKNKKKREQRKARIRYLHKKGYKISKLKKADSKKLLAAAIKKVSKNIKLKGDETLFELNNIILTEKKLVDEYATLTWKKAVRDTGDKDLIRNWIDDMGEDWGKEYFAMYLLIKDQKRAENYQSKIKSHIRDFSKGTGFDKKMKEITKLETRYPLTRLGKGSNKKRYLGKGFTRLETSSDNIKSKLSKANKKYLGKRWGRLENSVSKSNVSQILKDAFKKRNLRNGWKQWSEVDQSTKTKYVSDKIKYLNEAFDRN